MRNGKKYFTSVLCCVVAALIAGCYTIDRNVAGNASVPWIPPPKEEFAKKKQLAEYKKRDASQLMVFGDLDLPTLLDIAFENSPTTRKSWQAARIAAAQSGKAASIFFPKITVSGVVDRAETNTPIAKNRATIFYPAVEMQCSIFQFGGHSKSIEAARELLYAANYQYNRELQTLANKVQKCYFSLDSAEGAVEAGQKNLDDAIVAYDAAYMRNQFGLTSIHDFLQAKSNKARAEFELEKAKAQVESARANLAKVIGVPVSKNLQIARSDDSDDIKDFDINIEELIRETLQVRQDILAFHSIIKSKKNFVQKSESKFLPEFVIGGSGSRKRFHHEGGHFDNFDIYAALKWTVFDGFGNVYDLAESRAELKRAEEEFRQLRLNVASEVWEKYHSFKSAVRQLRAARNYEQAANESFDATVMAYSSGLSSFGDLMASQTQSASARQQTVASKNNLYIAVVDLLYAVGMEIFEPIRSEDNE